MIIDVTGIELTPGNMGKNCDGYIICCSECDYLMCCLEEHNEDECLSCRHEHCPNSRNGKDN